MSAEVALLLASNVRHTLIRGLSVVMATCFDGLEKK